jgi:hypothetical protein
MNPKFDDALLDVDNRPVLAAHTEAEFQAYTAWLADYLYRPDQEPDAAMLLSREDAWSQLIGIEIDIADKIWTSPFGEYPSEEQIPPSGQRHVDILHRRELSQVLSRVADGATRVSLLRDFYIELLTDLAK